MEHPNVEAAAKLLRRYGVSAYAQEQDIVLYVVDNSSWVEVWRFNTVELPRDVDAFESPSEIAVVVVRWVSQNLIDIHMRRIKH